MLFHVLSRGDVIYALLLWPSLGLLSLLHPKSSKRYVNLVKHFVDTLFILLIVTHMILLDGVILFGLVHSRC